MGTEIPERIVVRLAKLIEFSTRGANYHDIDTISYPVNPLLTAASAVSTPATYDTSQDELDPTPGVRPGNDIEKTIDITERIRDALPVKYPSLTAKQQEQALLVMLLDCPQHCCCFYREPERKIHTCPYLTVIQQRCRHVWHVERIDGHGSTTVYTTPSATALHRAPLLNDQFYQKVQPVRVRHLLPRSSPDHVSPEHGIAIPQLKYCTT